MSTLGFWYIQRYLKISTKKMVRKIDSVQLRRRIDIDDLVHRDERCHDTHPTVGYDWNLDAKVWVRFIESSVILYH